MTNETNYYSVLQTAISRTQPDSFEARGAVYDRLWQIVLDQLYANNINSEEEIAIERAAFLRAIQRIEFGGGPPPPEDSGQPPPDDDVRPIARPDPRPSARVRLARPRRRIVWRIVAAMVGACVVLLVGAIAYALIEIRSDSTMAARWADESTANSWQAQMMRAVISINNFIDRRPATTTPAAAQRAVLYEESQATATGTTFSGQAIWRQPSGKGTKAVAISVDVEIPQKDLFLRLTISNEPDGGGVISHLVEFRFFRADRKQSSDVQDVLGILMKSDELSRGIDLAGKVAKVQPGVFLMALSGAPSDVERNMSFLKERPWLDIPIVFQGGTRSLLAIEKGTNGQNAIDELLRSGGNAYGLRP